MDKTKYRYFDPHAGVPGVTGHYCAACRTTLIIINTRADTAQPLYCQACQEIIDSENTPIPYGLTDLAYHYLDPAAVHSP